MLGRALQALAGHFGCTGFRKRQSASQGCPGSKTRAAIYRRCSMRELSPRSTERLSTRLVGVTHVAI
jgi:hypothetical protein